MKAHSRPAISRQAFTLVELVLVLTILAVLGGSPIFLLKGNTDVAREVSAEGSIRSITSQLELYEGRNFRAPTTEQGLAALVAKPTIDPIPEKWTQLLEEIPIDPWGNPFQYIPPPERSNKCYDLFSSGPDGTPGNEDDIGNWK